MSSDISDDAGGGTLAVTAPADRAASAPEGDASKNDASKDDAPKDDAPKSNEGDGTLERHSDPVLAQFLSMLDVRVTAIAAKTPADGQKILDEVRAGLKNFPSLAPEKAWGLFHSGETERARYLYAHWTEAYRLERLLALIEPVETLLGELTRRAKEASDESVPAAATLNSSLDATKKTLVDETTPSKLKEKAEPILRMLLLEMLEELHWTYQIRFIAQPRLKSATLRTILVGLITFVLFLAPYIYAYLYCTPPDGDTDFRPFALFPLWSALTAGLFGAFFSRLMSLQSSSVQASLGALKDAREWTYILSRGFVGMCGALIVFLVLQAGLIEGNLFPKFAELGLVAPSLDNAAKIGGSRWTLILPNKPLALLVVWTFVAGFSERLVPNVLASTEKALNGAIDKQK